MAAAGCYCNFKLIYSNPISNDILGGNNGILIIGLLMVCGKKRANKPKILFWDFYRNLCTFFSNLLDLTFPLASLLVPIPFTTGGAA